VRRPTGRSREEACWAAEMFLNEWQSLAAEFEWTAEHIFALPRGRSVGLAYWLEAELVEALGPEPCRLLLPLAIANSYASA
jgi:hypothetical protein